MSGHAFARPPSRALSGGERPKQWPYLQAISTVTVLFAFAETLFTCVFVSRRLGLIGNYVRYLTTGCFWDGILLAGTIAVFFIPLQYFVATKSQSAGRLLKVFIATMVLVTLALINTSLAKLVTWLTIFTFDDASCTFFRDRFPEPHVGTGFNACLALDVPKSPSCCCLSAFSLTTGNATFVTDLNSCQELFGDVGIYYAVSTFTSCLLLVLSLCVLLVLTCLCIGCCGPRLSSHSGHLFGPSETDPLISTAPPSYASVSRQTSVADGQSDDFAHAPAPPGPNPAQLQRHPPTFDQGPPPDYRSVYR